MGGLTQPIEGYDCLSGNSGKTVEWSQPARGNLGDPPVLDPHIQEFFSETDLPGGRGGEPIQSVTPKPTLWWSQGVGEVAHLPSGDPHLVAGTGEGPYLQGPDKLCQVSMSFFSIP